MARLNLRPMRDVAREMSLHPDDLISYGDTAVKVRLSALERPSVPGRLVLVSAITPTPSGEGKTTVAIALAMALRRRDRPATVVLREPSLGPTFGLKGGGTGGGVATVEPADAINLHFTGDLHAITAAHNLLAAMIDNDLHFNGASRLDPRRVQWPRALDVDDRALRHVVTGLGRRGGVPRESQFIITAASEVMATLCLASSPADLRTRLGRIIVGRSTDGNDVTAEDIGAADAMAVLLRDAILPNLVQTREGGPALVHGGPFANVAHGAPSVIALRLALARGQDVVVEGGFGFDLGGEKFLHLVAPAADCWPRCVVLVASVRALQSHGRGDDEAALIRGLTHLDHQIENVRSFGLEPVVAVNVFSDDDTLLHARITAHCAERGVSSAQCTGYAEGGAGALDLADAVMTIIDDPRQPIPVPTTLYAADAPYLEKLRAVACSLYGARDVTLSEDATRVVERLEAAGQVRVPVCIAKTALSLSIDPREGGLPAPFVAHVDSVQLHAGAGFLVAHMGAIETMPGLPRVPRARRIRLLPDGSVAGLVDD